MTLPIGRGTESERLEQQWQDFRLIPSLEDKWFAVGREDSPGPSAISLDDIDEEYGFLGDDPLHVGPIQRKRRLSRDDLSPSPSPQLPKRRRHGPILSPPPVRSPPAPAATAATGLVAPAYCVPCFRDEHLRRCRVASCLAQVLRRLDADGDEGDADAVLAAVRAEAALLLPRLRLDERWLQWRLPASINVVGLVLLRRAVSKIQRWGEASANTRGRGSGVDDAMHRLRQAVGGLSEAETQRLDRVVVNILPPSSSSTMSSARQTWAFDEALVNATHRLRSSSPSMAFDKVLAEKARQAAVSVVAAAGAGAEATESGVTASAPGGEGAARRLLDELGADVSSWADVWARISARLDQAAEAAEGIGSRGLLRWGSSLWSAVPVPACVRCGTAGDVPAPERAGGGLADVVVEVEIELGMKVMARRSGGVVRIMPMEQPGVLDALLLPAQSYEGRKWPVGLGRPPLGVQESWTNGVLTSFKVLC